MSKIQIDNSQTSLSLESQMDRLALEAAFLANVIDTFKNVLPNLASHMSSLVKGFKDDNSDAIKSVLKNHKELDKKLKYAEFVTFSKTLISVPEGFKGNLLEYVILIDRLAPEVYNGINDTLTEYKAILSTFITNKDTKIALKDETGFFKKLENNRMDVIRQLDKFFPEDSNVSKAYLGDALHRFKDVEELVIAVKSLDKNHIAQNISNMNNKINECVDLLNVIIENINNKGIENVSGNASMNISKGAYEIAKYVEFVTVFRFKTMQAIATVDKLVTQLDEIL